MDLQRVDQIVEAYGRDPSQLLAVLQDIQAEDNWLPRDALERVAAGMGVPVARIYRLATFFQALSLKPRGKHIATVCMGTACHVRGAPRLVEKLERDLKIKAGETTADLDFTLETVNCVGACALGPLLIVDGAYHGNMTSAGLDKVVKGLRTTPAAGPPPAAAAQPAARGNGGETVSAALAPASAACGCAKVPGVAIPVRAKPARTPPARKAPKASPRGSGAKKGKKTTVRGKGKPAAAKALRRPPAPGKKSKKSKTRKGR